jgi:hypothetical protein
MIKRMLASMKEAANRKRMARFGQDARPETIYNQR